MPRSLDPEFRACVVTAYESGKGSVEELALRFSIAQKTLRKWVRLSRRDSLAWLDPASCRGRIDVAIMHAVVREHPTHRVSELTRAYNDRVPDDRAVHRQTLLNALRRAGYTFTKSRPDAKSIARVQMIERRRRRLRERILGRDRER